VSTVSIFVASKNREIVKSALGFVKVAVVALPLDTVTPHLHTLVPALLGWVHDHKNHFKQKTVHIFERMIRKFGYDEIIQQAGAGGERKVLENIKRRKERAKRKKSTAAEGEEEQVSIWRRITWSGLADGNGSQVPKPSSGNAYDDILYDSDSDLSSDGEADQSRLSRPVKPLKKKGKRGETAYLRHEGEQPMDLLSRSIAGGISSSFL